ncbi:carboxypeptidase-like regulatory domain-containing protein [Tenacibaculum soleae]|uniref:vWA domain-containing protein n=1 Tax=Tenacibaculum soleae TaxID=447689 RepID=UPI0026E1E051|nr:carboxypeptidase-like regulatory domain-containing protein [Tenacibaculum soleae]MDO6743744.1 carboxypeptidase-like regulatory domain-containing protein [Tenacibaculum soleae]
MLKKITFIFLITIVSLLQAQEKKITGIVSDNSGVLPGVTVLIKGTETGVETDFDGKYAIKASKGDVLVFSFIGMKMKEVLVKDKTIINVLLTENTHVLDEIVVAAMGIKRKSKSLTYSSKKIKEPSFVKIDTPQSGQLTAGEINDLEKWDDWKLLMKNDMFLKVKNNWKFSLKEKVDVLVKDVNNIPIINATVLFLDDKNKMIFKTKTDVFGKALVFKNDSKHYTLQVIYKNEIKGVRINRETTKIEFSYNLNEKLNDIDIMFTIDATGSMGDEINYLKSEIKNIITRVDSSVHKKRIGLTFYRDHGDEYVVRDFDFTTDITKIKENLSHQTAGGGGDYEEAVEEALRVSLSKSWNINAKSRLLFLLLDAPPHLNKENINTIKNQIKKAQEKGIKIIPIVASGADKTVEYLMRYFSVSTNGTYVFLTDDSGIGSKHLKPTTTDFKVEKLNNLIVRLINKYAGI